MGLKFSAGSQFGGGTTVEGGLYMCVHIWDLEMACLLLVCSSFL